MSLESQKAYVCSVPRSHCQRCPWLHSLRQKRLRLVHILACSCNPCWCPVVVHLAVSSSSTCWPTHTSVLYLVSLSASCIRALTMPCLSVSCLHIVSVSVSCTRTYSYDGASVCVWHRLGHVFGVHARGQVQRYISRPVKPLRSDTPSDPN